MGLKKEVKKRMAWVVSEKGTEVLREARRISKVTSKIVAEDSYLSVLDRYSEPFIQQGEVKKE